MWKDRDFANYIVGQADADSCFYIGVRHGKTYSYGIRVVPEWAVSKTADHEILQRTKAFLGIGRIVEKIQPRQGNRRFYSKLYIQGNECSILAEFFERFPLRANKRKDFEVWKKAVDLYSARERVGGNPDAVMRRASKRSWTKEELIEMLEIRKQLNDISSRVKRKKDLVTKRELLRLQTLV
jgi:hypothetical protein